MVSLALPAGQIGAPTVVYGNSTESQRRPQKRQPVRGRAARPPRIDYSQFSHITHVTTLKQTCDSCHKLPTPNWKEVRKGDSAFPDVADFPEHSTCLNCHRTQFFARERPTPVICSNCHVNATPRDTARFLFPSLGDVSDSKLKPRESSPEFRVNFPHEKHLDVVGSNRPGLRENSAVRFMTASMRNAAQKPAEQSKSCSICHQTYQPQGDSSEEYFTKPPKGLGDNFWLKKGTFQTVPNSHAACFSCHNAESEIPPAPKDCHICHQFPPDQKLSADFDPKLASDVGITDKGVLRSWTSRTSAGTFRHEGGEHPSLSCTGCHNPTVMNTVDPRTLKVPVPSCGGAEGCHITAKTDDGGALNYEIDQKKAAAGFVCVKCHITFGRETVPASHSEAILKLATK